MNQKELEKIIREFLENEEFQKLSILKHHNTTRLIHTFNVTLCSYNFAKKLKLNVNYENLIKGCLLHDFFLYEQYKCPKSESHIFYHPEESLRNSKKYFNITNIEENMIEAHMFPLSKKLPKYKETWIIILIDKYCAIVEKLFKKNYMLELHTKIKLKNRFVNFISSIGGQKTI